VLRNTPEAEGAARALYQVTRKALDRASEPLWGLDWEFDDEDWLRDTVRAVERYERWQETGEHDFIALRPGLEPQIALADHMLTGLGYLSRDWSGYGVALHVDDELDAEIRARMTEYLKIRLTGAGGPGTMNAELWQR
jgi:hypothetical protein